MGYESYDFRVSFERKKYKTKIIKRLLELNYKENEKIFEKRYDAGYIEILLEDNVFYLRTAKANNPAIIDLIFEDLDYINVEIPVVILDPQIRKNISSQNYKLSKNQFVQMHEEFLRFFPKILPPIRCEDIEF